MKNIKILLLLVILVFSFSKAQNFNTGKVYLKLTNAGSTLFGAPDKQTLQIVRVSPLISGSEGEVFDYLNDADSTETAAHTIDPPQFGQFQVQSMFDNSYSFAPPAYKITLNSYGWQNGDFAISHYNVTNIDSVSYQSKFGFEILPYVDNIFGNEIVVYDEEDDYIRIYRDTVTTFVGIKILSSPTTSLFTEDWVPGYNRSDSALYANLFHEGIVDSFMAADSGSVIVPSIQDVTVNPGESYDVFIALAAALSETTLDSVMRVAVDHYNEMAPSDVTDENLVNEFRLDQNYPNPFNPSTIIKFTIPHSHHTAVNNTKLIIYDILGREVKTLLNEKLASGEYKITFNASNLASGVYFYRLTTENFSQTRKMMLIR